MSVTGESVEERARHLGELLHAHAGVITRREALSLWLTDKAIRHRVRSGRWQRIHPGVYATFTGRPPTMARIWAALRYAGDDAVASHATAAWLDGFGDEPEQVDVPVEAMRSPGRQPGVRIHRRVWLAQRRHPVRQPPRTTIEETVLDLVEQASTPDAAVALLTRVSRDRLTTPARIAHAAANRKKLRWRAIVAEAVSGLADGVQSVPELRYLRDVERAHGLPSGRRQRRIVVLGQARYRDVEYPGYRTVVELDGVVGHDGYLDRLKDMARDNAAAVGGEVSLRYGWDDVLYRSCAVAGQVATVLRRAGWTGKPRRCGPDCAVT